jgi:hypothetical protein
VTPIGLGTWPPVAGVAAAGAPAAGLEGSRPERTAWPSDVSTWVNQAIVWRRVAGCVSPP